MKTKFPRKVICLMKLVRELRREANEQASSAKEIRDEGTREFLRGMAHGRREAALRIQNEHLPVSAQRELLKDRGKYS